MKALILTVIILVGGAAACSAEGTSTNWMARILTNDERFLTDAQWYWNVMTSGAPLATNADSFFRVMTNGSVAERRRAEVDLYLAVSRNVGPTPTAAEQDKEFLASIFNVKNRIESGASTEEEFRAYCASVDALVAEYAEEQQRHGGDFQARYATYVRFILYDVQILTGANFYLNPGYWANRKKQLEAFQKWKK